MGRRPLIAVVGDGALTPGEPREALAESVGEALVGAGYRVLTGGLGGVMAAACRGARRSPAYQPGDTVGVLPGHDPGAANPWVDVALATGLGETRNVLCARADAVVAIGGGAGTLSEIALAWVARRLVIGLRVDGWSGRMADVPVDARPRFVDLPDDRVFGADDAAEVVAILRAHLDGYVSRLTPSR